MHYIICRTSMTSISFYHNFITSDITSSRKLDHSFTDLLSQTGDHSGDEPNGDCQHDDCSNGRPERKFAVLPPVHLGSSRRRHAYSTRERLQVMALKTPPRPLFCR